MHYVPIPASTGTSPRLAGWRSALREAGAPIPEPLAGGWTAEAGYRAGQELAADPAVTAVLCGNDDLAVGVMRAMTEAGRPIPGSVSVVGFDDTPVAAYLTPGADHRPARLRRAWAGPVSPCCTRWSTRGPRPGPGRRSPNSSCAKAPLRRTGPGRRPGMSRHGPG